MGRWSHLDTDAERLPDGMVRIGYDADTQQYTFRDADGSLWESAPGCEYGRLFKVTAGRDGCSPRSASSSRPGSSSSTDSSSLPPGCEPSRPYVAEYEVPDDVKEFLDAPKRANDEKNGDDTVIPATDDEKASREASEKNVLDGVSINSRASSISSTGLLREVRRDSGAGERHGGGTRAQDVAAVAWSSIVDKAKETFGSPQGGTGTIRKDLQRRASVWASGQPGRPDKGDGETSSTKGRAWSQSR